MKDSGVEWIGDVPQKWVVKRLKYGVKIRNSRADISDSDKQYIGLENVESFSGKLIPTHSIYDTEQALVVREHDVLFGKLRPYLAKVCLVSNDAVCSGEFVVFYDYEYSQQFLRYQLLSNWFISIVDSSTYGTKMPRANVDYIRNLLFLFPLESEQKSIAAFLDKQCSKIDRLISLQEEMIAELQAYKQSVITEAVTKGLDPNVPMKDSGVEWIGEIPESWEVSKVLRGLSMKITDGPHETPDLYDDGVPFISAESIKNGKINFDLRRGNISLDYYNECSKKYIPEINDIYMVKSGATTGNIAMVETDAIFTIWSPLAVFRANDRFVPRFMYYVLQSDGFQKQVQLRWSFGTQQNIGMRVLETLVVPYLPIEEQQLIADYLEKKCVDINHLISLKQSKIDTLKEYKKSLIYECVTGKREIV